MVVQATGSDNLSAALAWEAAGCSVIPIRADGSKKPAVRWDEFQTTRADRAQIMRWWKSNPDYGIAVICGAVSGNLEMFELEARATDGASFDKIQEVAEVDFDNWDEWVLGHRTYAELTPSGGIHLLYRIEDASVPGNTKIANNASKECLAETRGEGGYVIVAPSGGKVHATGEAWVPINGSSPTSITKVPFSVRNDLLMTVHRALDETPIRPVPERTAPPQSTPAGMESPGDAYERVTSWADILEPHGWSWSHRVGGEDFWTRPGKTSKDGHSASTGHANDRDRLYVWSSSAGLPTETPLTKFFVYTELNHRGDFQASAAALRRAGFGTDRPLVHETDDMSIFDTPGQQPQRSEKPATGSESKDPKDRKLLLRPLTSYTMKRTKWLWENRIPLGEITLLGGREGTGKSSVLAHWAAQVTTGTMPGEFFGTPRRVIYVAAEDSTEKTIFPRMVAAGADPELISILLVDPESGEFGSPEFPVDCRQLEEMVRESDSAVVMLDPLLSNISSRVNVNQSRELRTALEPLRRVAERTECAIIGLAHLNKSTGSDVSSKFVGSRAFLEVARAVFSVGKLPKENQDDETDEFFTDQEQEYVLDQEKNNLGPCNFQGMTYKIVTANLDFFGEEIVTNKVVFTGETSVRVEDVLNGNGKTTSEAAMAKIVAFVKRSYAKARLLVSATEVCEDFESMPASTVRYTLRKAVAAGELSCPSRGLYGPPGAAGGGIRNALE